MLFATVAVAAGFYWYIGGEGFRTVGERRPAATVAMVEGGVGCNLLIVGGVGCTRAESQFQLF